MKQKRLRPYSLSLAGLLLILLGWAVSGGASPSEALIPLVGVMLGLTALTALGQSGPGAFL